MDGGFRQCWGEQLGGAGKPQTRLIGLDDALVLRQIGGSLAQHDYAGLAGQGLGGRGGVFGKDQLIRSGHLDRVDAFHLPLRVSGDEFATEGHDQFAYLHALLLRFFNYLVPCLRLALH